MPAKTPTRHHEKVPLPSDSIFLTFPEATQVSRLSRTTLYSLIAAGRLKTVKFGKARRITRASLEQLAQ